MKVGDLVKMLKRDVRGTMHGYPMIPSGTMGIVVPKPPEAMRQQTFVKLFGDGGTRTFLSYDLEVINESR